MCVLIEGLKRSHCGWRMSEWHRAEIETAMLIGHEAGSSEVAIDGRVRRRGEQFTKWIQRVTVEREYHLAMLEIHQTAENVSGLPRRIGVRNGFGIEPDQISAAIVGHGMMIVTDAVAFVIHEFRLFRCPADLHDAVGDDQHFVVPDASVDVVRASNALERDGVTASFETIGAKLEIFAHVLIVQDDVDMPVVDVLVRRPSVIENEHVIQ